MVSYIPGRLEEGYGLNAIAIHQLHQAGVKLIVTVDCGITAVEEARLCRELGMDLVITDHHECKDTLPQAAAVVDPHRPDGGDPHQQHLVHAYLDRPRNGDLLLHPGPQAGKRNHAPHG